MSQMSNGARTVMMIFTAAVVLGGIGWGVDALTRRADLGGRIDELAKEAGLKNEPAPAPAPEPAPVADQPAAPTVAPDDVPVRVGGEVRPPRPLAAHHQWRHPFSRPCPADRPRYPALHRGRRFPIRSTS